MHRFASSVASHIGLRRSTQEDAVLARPEIGLWAVMDGMGGHHAGDVASRCIADRLARLRAPSTSSSFLIAVQAGLAAAHDELNALPGAGGRPPPGSTCVVLMVWRDHFTCLWAGDSRLYQLRDGQLRRITRDHSRVQEMIDAGDIGETDAERHPHAHLVTRVVGAGIPFQPEVTRGRLQRGDVLLLCSDGVTRAVDDRRLEEILRVTAPEQAADTVIDAVLAGGAPDNASAAVVSVI
jgi:serine/threonine protein phosphatase PrpC